MNLSLTSTTCQLMCPQHQIHLIHLLDTPFAGQHPIGIALSYVHLNKPVTMLVRPSAFRSVIQILPQNAQKVRVSLNTFQYEYHPDNLVDLNGWVLRLLPPQGSDMTELIARCQDLLHNHQASFTHYCFTAQELNLIWLTLPAHRPQEDTLNAYRQASETSSQLLAELHPIRENILVASLPLTACHCQALGLPDAAVDLGVA